MIKQCAVTDIESRSECNPYNEEGFLPLLTSPMYSVVNDKNMDIFLKNKIQVCLPRNIGSIPENGEYFVSYSLDDFIKKYITQYEISKMSLTYTIKVCIDTAAGHLKKLHDAIRKAKEIHGDNLVIMAGNIASVEAFVELAKTGVDYIRVGIGGGGGCNTTSNTGVGQENLKNVILECKEYKAIVKHQIRGCDIEGMSDYMIRNGISYQYHTATYNHWKNINHVKIVADGISTYIKQCQDKYGWNDNGYAAINSLLFAGADLVMIGGLFAQCLESAADKGFLFGTNMKTKKPAIQAFDTYDVKFSTSDIHNMFVGGRLYAKYAGMSTHQEQKNYQPKPYWKWWWGNSISDSINDETIFYDFEEMKTHSSKHSFENSTKEPNYYSDYIKYDNIKPSEGSVKWIPVRWTLNEWLIGSKKQDEEPYLSGFVPMLQSAMAYRGAKTLKEFRS